MKRDPDIRDYIVEMIQHAHLVDQFSVGKTVEDLEEDVAARYALVKAIEVIGEGAYKIPKSQQEPFPFLPWEKIASMRHILVHEYYDMDCAIILQTARHHIPKILPDLIRIAQEIGVADGDF